MNDYGKMFTDIFGADSPVMNFYRAWQLQAENKPIEASTSPENEMLFGDWSKPMLPIPPEADEPIVPMEIPGRDKQGEYFELRVPRGMTKEDFENYRKNWEAEKTRIYGDPHDLLWIYRRPSGWGDFRFYPKTKNPENPGQ